MIVASFILVALAKYTLFRDGDSKFYEDVWASYEKNQYDLTIFYLNHVDKNKFPDIIAPLGFSYFEKG